MASIIRIPFILLFLINYLSLYFVNCKIFKVANIPQFIGALDEINAGDKILLKTGTYRGDFELPELGRGKSHTLITSESQNAKSVVFSGRGRDPPFLVNGTRWAITKITITNKLNSEISTGLVLKKNEAFIKDVIFKDVDVGIHAEGNKIAVENCEIHATRTGVYMQGNGSVVTGNRFYGANPCLFMDDVSCCGIVKENRCDQNGAVFVNGLNYKMDEKTKKAADQNKFVEK